MKNLKHDVINTSRQSSSISKQSIWINFWFVSAIFLSISGEKNIDDSFQSAGFSDGQVFLLIIAVLLFIQLCLDVIVYNFHRKILKKWGTPEAEEYIKAGPLNQFWNNFMGLVPVHREKELVIEGHEIDGIEELDNTMPPWLKWLFYGTIVIGFIYIMYYIVLGIGDNQYQEYDKEMAAAEQLKNERLKNQSNQIDENSVIFLTADADLSEGKQIFMDNCATCHGQQAGGGAGPNLTDEYWIHGGGINNVYSTIKYGVIEKGMISWQTKLTPVQIQKVASYVLSLKGSNPPGGLPPAGEKWEE